MFKQAYYDALMPKPVWPMQMHRVNAIYGTMKRTIRQSKDDDKTNLKQQLLATAHDFENNCHRITANQSNFDTWFDLQVQSLRSIPFQWTDARNIRRSQVTFGLAQKFLNLTLKDWWCMSPTSEKLDSAVLHAPFDNIMRNKLWAKTKVDFPSLKQGGYYVYLSRNDYDRYQQHLLSPQLWSELEITQPLKRIEVEQLIWGT